MARLPLLSSSNSSSEPSRLLLLRAARHLLVLLVLLLFPGGPNCGGLARAGKPAEVTKFDFNATIRDPKRCALVKFTVPYCAHCQVLRKVWDELHERFSGAEHAEDALTLANVDCNHPDNKELCYETYGIAQYPTIRWFKPGHPSWDTPPHHSVVYSGSRELKELRKFVKRELLGGGECDPKSEENCRDEEKSLLRTLDAEGVPEVRKRLEEEEASLEALNSKETQATFETKLTEAASPEVRATLRKEQATAAAGLKRRAGLLKRVLKQRSKGTTKRGNKGGEQEGEEEGRSRTKVEARDEL